MADAIDQLIDDVLVDAYGPDEQLCAFQQAFEDTATFPFASTIAGADIDVTDIDYDGDDHRGLLAVCRSDGQRHTMSLLDVVPAPSLTAATRQLIDAYRRWAGAEPLPPPSDPPVRRKQADRTTRHKPPATPTLDALKDHERGEVLVALLRSSHPELLTEPSRWPSRPPVERGRALINDSDALQVSSRAERRGPEGRMLRACRRAIGCRRGR